MLNRRSFIQASLPLLAPAAASGLLMPLHTAWAVPAPASAAAPDARFLLVFLRGGYDGLSALVPQQRGFYDEVRRSIALPAAELAPLDADWALHPALARTLQPLLQEGQVCFVPFAGTPNASRSHFDTQDSIELGLATSVTNAGGGAAGQGGMLNRLLQQLPGRAGIGFTDRLPLALGGELPVVNVSLKSLPRLGDGSAALQAGIEQMYRPHALHGAVQAAFDVRGQVTEQLQQEQPSQAQMARTMTPNAPLAQEMAAANRSAVSTSGFEREARRLARMLRDHYSLGFVDVGGWDTHYNQGAASGALAGRLEELGRGLAALADEMGPQAWRRTVVMVVSEFGRTVRENGTRGTDHGRGSVYWVLGGGLTGRAPVRGEQAAVSAAALVQSRDLPVLNDYRALMAGLWARQFGLDARQLGQVFAGVAPLDLGLL